MANKCNFVRRPDVKAQHVSIWGFYCSKCGHRWAPPDYETHKYIGDSGVLGPKELPAYPPQTIQPETCPGCESGDWWHRFVPKASPFKKFKCSYCDVQTQHAHTKEEKAEFTKRRFYDRFGNPTKQYTSYWKKMIARISKSDLEIPVESENNVADDDSVTLAFHYRTFENLYAHHITTLGHLIALSESELVEFDNFSSSIRAIKNELIRHDPPYLLRPSKVPVPKKLERFRSRPAPKPVLVKKRYILCGERLSIKEIAYIGSIAKLDEHKLSYLLNDKVAPEEAIGPKYFVLSDKSLVRTYRNNPDRQMKFGNTVVSNGEINSRGLREVIEFVRSQSNGVQPKDVIAKLRISPSMASRYLTRAVQEGFLRRRPRNFYYSRTT